MEDRVSLYPGRVMLIPVEGQPNTYDMVRADKPIQTGTSLGKVSLLKDTTAAQFGLGSEAVPDDVLSWVGKYNEYWWSLLHGEAYIEYEEEKTYRSMASSPAEGLSVTNYAWSTKDDPVTIQYASDVDVNRSTGEITLKNPDSTAWTRTLNVTTRLNYATELLGKYILGAREVQNNTSGTSSDARSNIYFIPSDATIGVPEDSYTIMFKNFYSVGAKPVQVPAGETTYEHSTNRNAYPDSGTVDGITYQYLGKPFEKLPGAVQMAMGSYTGTGVYGSNNSNKLTFAFEPKMLFLRRAARGYTGIASGYTDIGSTIESLITDLSNSTVQVTDDFSSATAYNKFVTAGSTMGSGEDIKNSVYFKKSTDGKTIAWKAASVGLQFNTSGVTYLYVAIG